MTRDPARLRQIIAELQTPYQLAMLGIVDMYEQATKVVEAARLRDGEAASEIGESRRLARINTALAEYDRVMPEEER